MRGWGLIALMVVAGLACDDATPRDEGADLRALLDLPDHLQLPAIPERNPLTAEKIELGRHLFYDTRLSANQTQSCGTCHLQARAFTDDKRTPTGSTGTVLARNSMGLSNVAYFSTLTWASKGLTDLEQQIAIPIRADDPVELGVTDGVREEVLARFDADPMYQTLFSAAFPDSESGATINKIIFALASFCRTLISARSPYDRYINGDTDALSDRQRLGLALFNGERFECFHCHGGTLQTGAYVDAQTPAGTARLPFFNNGLYNVDGEGGYPPHDQGLYELTLNPRDRGLFRPPSLRNVELTAPYMHDGSIATLREVVEHYVAGGRNIESGPFAGDGRLSPLKSGLVRGVPNTTDEEIDAIVAFLASLTDEDFITNPALSDPFTRTEESATHR